MSYRDLQKKLADRWPNLFIGRGKDIPPDFGDRCRNEMRLPACYFIVSKNHGRFEIDSWELADFREKAVKEITEYWENYLKPKKPWRKREEGDQMHFFRLSHGDYNWFGLEESIRLQDAEDFLNFVMPRINNQSNWLRK